MDTGSYNHVSVEGMWAETGEHHVNNSDLTMMISSVTAELNQSNDEMILPDVPDSNQNDVPISLELSKEDEADEKAIVSMFGCDETPSEPCCLNKCNSKIPKELALQHRYTFQELDKKEKDLVILSHLQQHRRISLLISEYAKLTDRKPRLKKEDTLTRQQINYYFCDLQICKKMYFFIHDLGKKEFKNIVKHYDEQGLAPRVHKLTSSKPKRVNVLTPEDIGHIVAFIKTYSETYGRQMPRRTAKLHIPQYKNYMVVALPEHMSKTAVYNEYCKAGGKQVALRTFLKTWNTYCPYIISRHRQATCTAKHNGVETKSEDEEFLGNLKELLEQLPNLNSNIQT